MLIATALAALALAAAPDTATPPADAAATPAAAQPAKTKKVCEKLPADSTSRLRRSTCRTVKVEEKAADKPAEAQNETEKAPG